MTLALAEQLVALAGAETDAVASAVAELEGELLAEAQTVSVELAVMLAGGATLALATGADTDAVMVIVVVTEAGLPVHITLTLGPALVVLVIVGVAVALAEEGVTEALLVGPTATGEARGTRVGVAGIDVAETVSVAVGDTCGGSVALKPDTQPAKG